MYEQGSGEPRAARPTLPRAAETARRGPSPPPKFCVSCAPNHHVL
jgi:hypothetical protein